MAYRISYRNIAVVDVEATCWENGNSPLNERQEIIEVGIAVLQTETSAIIAREGYFIYPQRSRVSPFCESLTGITQKFLEEKGDSFATVCAVINEKYGGMPWASYGDFDRALFEDNCEMLRVRYPWSHDHINVKPLATLFFGIDRPMGLRRATTKMGLGFEGTQHRGIDDAQNVALVLGKILQKMRA